MPYDKDPFEDERDAEFVAPEPWYHDEWIEEEDEE